MQPTRGILFFATGATYLEYAKSAIERVKNIWPDLTIALATNEAGSEDPELNRVALVYKAPSGSDPYHEKILAMAEAPFERTLFLDVDTYLLEPVPELFQILDHYDVAASLVPGKRPGGKIFNETADCQVEFNTGVVCYRNSEKVTSSLLSAASIYTEGRQRTPDDPRFVHDQPAICAAMWKDGVRIFQLGTEYNLRPNRPSYLRAPVKIIHSWVYDPSSLISRTRGQTKRLPCVVGPLGSTVNKSSRLEALRAEMSNIRLDSRVERFLKNDKRQPTVASQTLPETKRRIDLLCPLGDRGVVESVISSGEYLIPRLKGLRPKTILDVGAHVGTASRIFSTVFPNAKIFAFEPSHFNLAFAERNLTEQSDSVSLFSFGLSDENRMVELYHGDNLTAASSLYNHVNSSELQETVEIRDAAEVLKELELGTIDILKLDTEGSELKILDSLSESLRDVSVIMLEYHSENDRRRIDRLLSGDFVLVEAEAHRPDRGNLKFVNSARLEALSKDTLKRRPIESGF